MRDAVRRYTTVQKLADERSSLKVITIVSGSTYLCSLEIIRDWISLIQVSFSFKLCEYN